MRFRPALLAAFAILAAISFTNTFGAVELSFSTYFGGRQYDGAYAVVVDRDGNIFFGGSTSSTNTFPILNALQPAYGGGFGDAFLAKLDPQGRLVFSTFFGGTGYDAINDMALDPEGNLVVVGETRSVDLPTTDDAWQYDYSGGSAFGWGDGFIARFSPDGQRLLYCSYFGADGDDKINRLALGPEGTLYVTGQTDSQKFPLRNPFQASYGGGDSDGFLAIFDPTFTNLVYSSYFGGENRDEDLSIALGPDGFIYLAGQTLSTNFPVTFGAFQTNHAVVEQVGENWDAFVAKFKPGAAGLVYSTYVGDATYDAAFAISADAKGCAYVTGAISASWDDGTFPLGFQPAPGYGHLDGWVAKLKPDGSNFEWFSYLGGKGEGILDNNGEDVAYDLKLDKDSNVFVTGITESKTFPLAGAFQTNYGGGLQDSFVAKISADGQKLLYSTYLGGSGEEWGYRIAVDPEGNAVAVGQTPSTDFPVIDPIQSTNAQPRVADAYVTRLILRLDPPRLTIAVAAGQVQLSWPTNAVGYQLESSAGLGQTAGWQSVTNSPEVKADQFVVRETAADSARFYRLHKRTVSFGIAGREPVGNPQKD